MSIFWGAVIVLLPLYYKMEPMLDSRVSKNYLFFSSVIISCLLFSNKKKFDRITIFIVCLSILSLFNMFAQRSGTAMYQFTFFNISLLLIEHLRQNIDTSFHKKLIPYLIVSALIQSTWIFLEFINIEPLYVITGLFGKKILVRYPNGSTQNTKLFNPYLNNFITGCFSNRSVSGAALACLVPAFFYKKKLIPLVIFPIAAVFICRSTMSIMAMLAGVVVYLSLIIRTKTLYALLLATLAIATISFGYYIDRGFFSDTHRFEFWLNAFSMWKNYFFGHGVGFFSDHYNHFFQYRLKVLHLHSDFLQMFFNFGIVGGVLFIFMLLHINFKASAIYIAMLSSVLFNSLGNFSFHISFLTLISIVSYSIIVRKDIHLTRKLKHGHNNSN